MRWCCRGGGAGGGAGGGGGGGEKQKKSKKQMAKCLTIIQKFDKLIVGEIFNNKERRVMKTRLIALATAHNKAGEQKKTALLQNLEKDWEEYIIAPYYDEDKRLWYGSGQYMLDTSARDAFVAYICYLDHDNFAVDTWEEKVGEHKTRVHQAIKFFGEL